MLPRGRELEGSPPRERGQVASCIPESGNFRFTPARAGTGGRSSSRPCAPSVHPRASGDRTDTAGSVTSNYGSPPRERGQGLGMLLREEQLRFTPARAGTGDRGSFWVVRGAVHPRASGDRYRARNCSGLNRGSPPRERGQVLVAIGNHSASRFTPARAGTGCSGRKTIVRLAVHPRASGDRSSEGSMDVSFYGSPPRERGQVETLPYTSLSSRFTPARAGTGRR